MKPKKPKPVRHPAHVIFCRDDATSVCGVSIASPSARMLRPGEWLRRDERPCAACQRELRKALEGTHPTLIFPEEDRVAVH
jgi:hypothetical protein